MSKQKMCLSFSGGLTSAYMAEMMLANYSDKYDMVVTFANTGQERDETLDFVKKCDDELGFNTVWLEAVVHHGSRKGCTHKVVDYDSADRTGAVFEEMIKKYGLPNPSFLHCTRELKLNPMRSYLKSIGWKDYKTAIGIRSDEPDRIREDAADVGIVYPLAQFDYKTECDIDEISNRRDFKLGLMKHEGNCQWCYKKSLSKHIKLMKDRPHQYDFPMRMEKEYGMVKQNIDEKRVIFRENRSTIDMFKLLDRTNKQIEMEIIIEDATSSCGQSCEVDSAIAGEI